MEWLNFLFFGSSVAQSIIVTALVIACGLLLSKVKIGGISFGVTWILFIGITFGHFGLKINAEVLHFIKEFGLILFVYAVGLQCGPGFFSSFKKGGLRFNMLAATIVLLGVAVTLILYAITGLPITTMIGILSGAVTNTPGLGAAQQTFTDITGGVDTSIATGYALAYPLAVVGIISSIIVIKKLFKIDIDREERMLEEEKGDNPKETIRMAVLLNNPSIFGKSVKSVKQLLDVPFIISRVLVSREHVLIANANTILEQGHKLLIILQKKDRDAVLAFLGEETPVSEDEWGTKEISYEPFKILVTNKGVNGKSLANLGLGKTFGITVTRINRSGIDLVATPSLELQMGDRLTVVGAPGDIASASKLLGNSTRQLREPHLFSIFLGISLGILLGSIPFFIPGIPQPIKLGLAGGPLIIAILIGKFGPKYKLVTYTTRGANLMLREIGISLFLAAVGLGAGENFVDTIVNGGGAWWILYGIAITVIPLLLVSFVAIKFMKINYFTLTGLIAGSTTDPPALAYANNNSRNDLPAVAYATVYPLTMFLRVLSAQLLIVFFV